MWFRVLNNKITYIYQDNSEKNKYLNLHINMGDLWFKHDALTIKEYLQTL